VEFDTTFFFLGGGGGTAANSVQGGFAAHAFGGVIGAYYNGGFFNGSGSNNGADDSDNSQINTEFTWSDRFALLYANEAIGGIRLDVLLPSGTAKTHEQGENAGTPNTNGSFTPGTTIGLEWGNPLGPVTARFAVGFKFPDYTKEERKAPGSVTTDTTAEKWSGAALALKALVGWGDFSGDTQFTFDFGEERKGAIGQKGYTYSQTGYFHNATNLFYAKTLPLAESFSLKVRPGLRFQFYVNEYKAKESWDNHPGGTRQTSFNSQAPVSEFQFNPTVDVGAQYTYKKISLYAGTSATLFTINTRSESKWTNYNDVETKDEPSYWQINRLNWASTTLNLAAEVNFNEKIGLEMGFTTPLLSIGMPGSSGSTDVGNPFDITSGSGWLTSGNLLVKFKL
jgi:hypothetical protein